MCYVRKDLESSGGFHLLPFVPAITKKKGGGQAKSNPPPPQPRPSRKMEVMWNSVAKAKMTELSSAYNRVPIQPALEASLAEPSPNQLTHGQPPRSCYNRMVVERQCQQFICSQANSVSLLLSAFRIHPVK